MIVLVVLAACWLIGILVALGLCRAAALADEAMDDAWGSQGAET